MRRRKFIGLIGAALVGPLAAKAQDAKAPTIGVLVLGNPNAAPFLKMLREGLEKVGYIEGQNIRLEIRSAGGIASDLAPAVAELIRLKVDIVVAWQTPAVTAAKQATSEIPIVMAGAGDPVGTGLIASLARPGGNITGISGVGAELAGKNVELIREVLPAARRLAVLANATDPFTRSMLAQIELTARNVGIQIETMFLVPGESFDKTFEELRGKKIDAVFIQPTLLRTAAVDLANSHRLPSFSFNRSLTELGGLIAYAPNFTDQHRETAVYVDKILKGIIPADLPVAQPTKFDLIVNLKTAKAIGLAIPQSLLARADEVIE